MSVILPILSPSLPTIVRPCHWYASVISGDAMEFSSREIARRGARGSDRPGRPLDAGTSRGDRAATTSGREPAGAAPVREDRPPMRRSQTTLSVDLAEMPSRHRQYHVPSQIEPDLVHLQLTETARLSKEDYGRAFRRPPRGPVVASRSEKTISPMGR